VYEGNHLIGIDGPWGGLSLEPGGQVEWSSRPAPTLAKLESDLRDHLAAIAEVGDESGVRWLDTALQPDLAVSDMPWMPKARYRIMSRYLGRRGRLAHRMMTQTASIQCSFDYEDAEDWRRKFLAGALLAPVAAALFANSSKVDGEESGWRSYRQAIWRETDPDRCGLPPIVFDPAFDVAAWVAWACEVPVMFVQRGRGLVPLEGVPFRQLLDQVGCEAVSLEDWELHLSCIFTDVRSYSYIEVRSADLLPDARIAAVPAFWKGILYDSDRLGEALELGGGHRGYEAWNEAMLEAGRNGLEGMAGRFTIRELASRAVGLALEGLGDDEPTGALVELSRASGLEIP